MCLGNTKPEEQSFYPLYNVDTTPNSIFNFFKMSFVDLITDHELFIIHSQTIIIIIMIINLILNYVLEVHRSWTEGRCKGGCSRRDERDQCGLKTGTKIKDLRLQEGV